MKTLSLGDALEKFNGFFEFFSVIFHIFMWKEAWLVQHILIRKGCLRHGGRDFEEVLKCKLYRCLQKSITWNKRFRSVCISSTYLIFFLLICRRIASSKQLAHNRSDGCWHSRPAILFSVSGTSVGPYSLWYVIWFPNFTSFSSLNSIRFLGAIRVREPANASLASRTNSVPVVIVFYLLLFNWT